MQNSLRVILINIVILSTTNLGCMNVAQRLVRTRIIHHACERQSPHALVPKRVPAFDYHVPAKRQRRLRQSQENNVRLLNALHTAVFDFDEKLFFLLQQQRTLAKEIEYKKLDHKYRSRPCHRNGCLGIYKVNEAREILDDIKKLAKFDEVIQTFAQWRLNACREIKQRQGLLTQRQDEQKHISAACWFLDLPE